MKKLRNRLPIVFCIVSYILWVAAQSVFSIFGNLLMIMTGCSDTLLPQFFGEIGCILMVIFLLWRTGRLQLLKDRGIGFFRGMLFGIVPIAFLLIITLTQINFTNAKLNGPLTIFILVLTSLSIGMAEDFLCRGMMAETLLEHFGPDKKGILKAILISSVIFALTHLVNLAESGFSGVLLQVINAFFVGVLFAAIYFRTGNIMIAAVIHALWDFCGLIQSDNGLFSSNASINDIISSYKFDVSALLTFIMIVVYVFILMRFSNYEDAVRRYFGGYCGKTKEERLQ
jgi:membrane protease YdiL (CAAX protease family)